MGVGKQAGLWESCGKPADGRRKVPGDAGRLLRAFGDACQATTGRRYMMHGGDMRAAQRLLRHHAVGDLVQHAATWWDVVDEVRGTDEARYWPPTFCAFASRLAHLQLRTDPASSKLSAEQVSALNLAGWEAYQAAKAGEPEAANPYPVGSRRWAHWRRHHRFHVQDRAAGDRWPWNQEG